MTYKDFFENAPAMNPRAELIKGKVCGVQVETIEDQDNAALQISV